MVCHILNCIVGNGDAHAKNFPVVCKNAVYRLSPAYDIVSTAIYPEVRRRMVMKVDGEYGFKWIGANGADLSWVGTLPALLYGESMILAEIA